MSKIELFKGNDLLKTFTVFEDNTPVDITDATLDFYIAKKNDPKNPFITKQITNSDFSDPTNGVGNLSVDRSEFEDISEGSYIFGLDYNLTTGKKITVDSGEFILKVKVGH